MKLSIKTRNSYKLLIMVMIIISTLCIISVPVSAETDQQTCTVTYEGGGGAKQAEETLIYSFSDTDTGNFWSDGTAVIGEFHGKQAVSVGKGIFLCGNLKDAGSSSVDLSGYDYLTIDVCIAEGSPITNVGVALSSTKDSPTPGYYAHYGSFPVVEGWNTITLETATTEENWDASEVFFIIVNTDVADTWGWTNFMGWEMLEDGEITTTQTTVEAGTKITLPENTFSKEGYAFAGWTDGNITDAQDTLIDVTKTKIYGADTEKEVDGETAYEDELCPVYCATVTTEATELPDYVKVDLYISDASARNTSGFKMCCFELNNADISKTLIWDLTYVELVDGWNELILKVEDAFYSQRYQTPITDISEVCSIRYFQYTTDIAVISVGKVEFGYSKYNYLPNGFQTYAPWDTYTVTSDTTFTALWKKLYNVRYVGGEGATGTPPTQKNVTAGTTITLADNPFTKEGYVFGGWSHGDVGDTVTIKKDTVITPVWKKICTVTYVGATGAIGTALVQDYIVAGTSFTLPENPFTKDGYVFGGWSHGAVGDTVSVRDDTTITAIWKKLHTVTYEGGEGATGVAPSQSPVASGTEITLAENTFTKEGYVFKGWSGYQDISYLSYATGDAVTSSGNWNFGMEADDGNGIYYSSVRNYCPILMFETLSPIDVSRYFESPTAKLHFEIYVENTENIEYGQFEFYNTVLEKDEVNIDLWALKLKDGWNVFDISPTAMVAEGTVAFDPSALKGLRIFIGRNTTGKELLFGVKNVYFYDTAFVSYEAGDPYTVNMDTSFTAIWEESETPAPITYTVTYVGGEGTTGTVPTQEPVTAGTKITLPENTLTKEGYAFAGWSDGVNIYYAGDTYTVNNDTVFTAVWHLPTLMRVLVSHNSQRFNGLATKDVALQFKGSDISETQSIIISFDKTKVAPITTVNGAESLGEECYLYEAWDAASKDYSGKLAYNSDGEEYFYDLADTVKSGLTVTDKWQSSGVVPVISYAEIGNTGYISIIVHQDKKVTYSDFTSAVTLRFALLNGSFDDNSIKLATTAQANSLNSSTSATLSAYSGDELITYVYYDSGNNISTLSTPKIEVKGFAISGKVTYDNPKEPIGILLYEGETLVDSVWPGIIDATGSITRDFSLTVNSPGTYSIKITKADALDYVINNIVITENDIDLTKSSKSEISHIRLTSGDINGDGYIDTLDITSFVFDMGKSEIDARYDHTDMNGDKYRDALDVAILAAGVFTSAPVIEYTP